MDQITRVLEKLNLQRNDETITLADFMPLSLAETRNKTAGRLSREEAQLLHRAARKEKQNNILYTARTLTRANPLLRKEMGVARRYGATPYGYDDIIAPRADEFAAPGAVSSMFSPAAYLTELYREARDLHQTSSPRHLGKRRPDLAKLTLSQHNLDSEISTLTLANEQLESALMAKAGQTDKAKYDETLATSRNSGVTPYNAPFEHIREALAQQVFSLPDNVLSKGAESPAQLALAAGISPELYAILTEKTDGLSEAETDALVKKNFPGVNTESLMNPDALANYYGLPRDDIQALPESMIKPGTKLLTLNKILRLAKVSGMTPVETQRVLTRLHVNGDDTEAATLHHFTEALHYRKRYSIDTETALMLCNADISWVSYNGQLSQFDRLFNNPPLNGITFTTGDTDIPMRPDTNDPRREVLKRAFRVDNTGLWQLFHTEDPSDSDNLANFAIDVKFIYMCRLLTDVHHLTVAQLAALLHISPYYINWTSWRADPSRREIINFLYQTTQWLTTQNITVEQLVMLLTKEAPAVPTQEMTTLLDALRTGGVDSNALLTTMAPVIAAAMQLENPEQGEALLHWLDNHHPAGILTTKDIWPLITTEKPTADQQKQLAAWCQALALRVLVIRTFALSGTEVQILSQGAPTDTIAALREISDFHTLINRCGEQAGTVLDALQNKALTAAVLANALMQSENVITQALTQAGQNPELTTWQQLATLPPRLDLADQLHITPKDITNLLTVTEKTAPSYAELTTLSALLQSGLNEQQTQQLHNRLEARRSEALSGEYRSRIMQKAQADRDDIWRELLIDGKVSAEITTTRLADAIAGIQLYINRTIAGDEPGADSAVLNRQFFKDWDTYNKRYSTWAGVSQLVYYPENTIDPTIRIGQTGMMNSMLEQLSQSELNSDTLENAFRQYLTAFEQIANLKVVSGYHDTVDINQGNTWFIGTSQTEPKKYYWRKADHSKFRNGRFAANAWSDWKEITCAVNPYQDMVRPVIYRSRLYLLWVEEQKRKDDEGKKDISSFTLKLSHIKYDGSWASPFSYDVSDKLTSEIKYPGLYCTADTNNNTLLIACYNKLPDGATETPDIRFGLRIQPDMTRTDAPDVTATIKNIATQLDSVSVVRVNTLLSGRYHTEFNLKSRDGNTGLDLTLEPGSHTFSKTGNKNTLTLNPTAYITINYDELFPSVSEIARSICLDYLASPDIAVYVPESTSFRPLNSKFPESDVTFTLVNFQYDQTSFIFLTIKNKTSWEGEAPINIWCDNQNDSKSIYYLQLEEYDEISAYIPYNYARSSTYMGPAKYTLNGGGEYSNAELSTGKLIKRVSQFSADNICIEFIQNGSVFKTVKGSDTSMKVPEFSCNSGETLPFSFNSLSLNLPESKSKQDITVKVSFKNSDFLTASTSYQLTLETPETSKTIISLHTTADGAQYMEWDAYRTRLNTLFARQFIERAANGIDAVLSPETQSLREPKPGQGTYVTLTLKPYDPAIHGSDRKFTIYHNAAVSSLEHIPVASGILSTTQNTKVTIFLCRLEESYKDKNQFWISAEYQSGESDSLVLVRDEPTKGNIGDYDPNGWKVNPEHPGFAGLESVSGLTQPDEPMDFSGANALYFWELFYYTPIMVAMRLLQEQNFTEANRWLSYIWRPASNGGDWRVRPLQEDTTWNADPLDSADPDAVAQNDPMHYKVSTLMKVIDLLIARGDSAYRMLERDTLNEAKMWYMQALGLLGDKPLTLTDSTWGNPSLSSAADKTRTKQFHEEISHVRNGGLRPEPFTANTLTGLFLPQQNEKLLGYWQTLEMRLFNLRNNLSIDGQPLSLPIFAAPADPAALLSAAAAASGGSKALPSADKIPAMRFPQALESARSLTGQLMQFGATLQGLIERQDAEAMSELLQNQAGELMLSSLRMQEQALAELDAEKKVLEQNRAGAQSRFDSYRTLYDENVSAAEQRTMDLHLSSSVLSTSVEALAMAEAVADMAPNVFGMAVGGSRWGGIPKAIGSGIALAASATKITADNITQSEAWRRRRQEWEIQKNNAESEVKQIDAQLEALTIRRTATEMQREHLVLQQAQTQAQLEFLQRKFSNKALYSWLRGRLAAIYYRFYDLTAARCMMAETAYRWQTGETTRYIKPGAWQSSNAGLMAGESLLVNLTEMEQAWLKWDHRALEVTRTVSLADVYRADKVDLAEKIADLLKGSGSGSTPANTGLSLTTDKQLHAAFNLKALNITDDYPAGLGKTRRIKQISVTLPALTGPYQDVRAVLSYGGDVKLPDGCKAIAVSHGMNDDGQFRLDFNDGHWLPFEGIPVDNDNSLTLSFPGATDDKQKALLLSLSDIIIHIRYTIR